MRGEQPESVLALKMACLDMRLKEMSALVGLLSTPDKAIMQHAVEAVSRLSSVQTCGDVAALTAEAMIAST